MRAHVDACVPFEACGLLGGKNDRVEQVIPVPNEAASPTRFRMDPREQIRAFGLMEAQGLVLLGIFHSHPAEGGAGGPVKEEPSASDIAAAAYPVVYVVWSRPGGRWQARGFWIEGEAFSEVKLHVAQMT